MRIKQLTEQHWLQGVFYHGTARRNLTFDPGRVTYLTPDIHLAKKFALEDSESGGIPVIIRCTLSVRNPIAMNHMEMQDLHGSPNMVNDLLTQGFDCAVGGDENEVCVFRPESIHPSTAISLQEKFTNVGANVGGQDASKGPMGNPTYTPSRPTASLNAIEWYMAQQGYERLGTGNSANAYEDPKNPGWILKILPHRDRGYFRFYAMAKNSQNEHFPEVGRMGVLNMNYHGKPFSAYAVMVEKLEKNENANAGIFAYESERYLLTQQPLSKEYTMRWPKWVSALDEVRELAGMVKIPGDDWTKGDAIPAGWEMANTKTKFWYGVDLHDQNIMWREGIPVIIDPLTGR